MLDTTGTSMRTSGGSFVSPATVSDGRWRGFGQRVDTGRECSCESRPCQVGELAEHSLLHCADRIRCVFQSSATTLSQFGLEDASVLRMCASHQELAALEFLQHGVHALWRDECPTSEV